MNRTFSLVLLAVLMLPLGGCGRAERVNERETGWARDY